MKMKQCFIFKTAKFINNITKVIWIKLLPKVIKIERKKERNNFIQIHKLKTIQIK